MMERRAQLIERASLLDAQISEAKEIERVARVAYLRGSLDTEEMRQQQRALLAATARTGELMAELRRVERDIKRS